MIMPARNFNNNSVYQQVKEMMFNYEIIPGQKLGLDDIAAKLGVSRTPVNGAFNLLAKEGFLDFMPNQGYTVHQITREEWDSLHEIREALELYAVEKAIRNLTQAKSKLLIRKEKNYNKALADNVGRGRFFLDLEYHSYIVEMSGNFHMAEYFREVCQRIFLRHQIIPLSGERSVQAPIEHHEIVEAIQSRNVAKARKAIAKHIKLGKTYVHSFIFAAER